MERVFISYSHHDRGFVDRFVVDLGARNIPFWRDAEEIAPWDAWDDDVQEVLSSGTLSHAIYIHSAAAAQSVNVKNELRLLAKRGIKIIVLALDDSELPLSVMWATPHPIYKDYDAGFEKLIYWLNTKRASPDRRDSLPFRRHTIETWLTGFIALFSQSQVPTPTLFSSWVPVSRLRCWLN